MSAAPLPAAEKKILIVEADPVLQEEWSNGLRDYGFKVAVTADGEDGFVKAEKSRPDLILLRVELPNTNGYKVVKKLKEHDFLKDVPLVLISSEASEKDFETHKKTKARAQAYRRLPFSFDDVLEDVENLVGLPGPVMADFQAEAVSAEKYNELEGARSELLVEIDRLKEQIESRAQENQRLEARIHEVEQALSAKAGAAAEALTSEITSLRGEVEAVKVERDESRSEVDSKKRIINKLKENITKLDGSIVELTAKAAELDDVREELDSKKKVIAKLKENIGKLETNTDLEDLRGDVESKKKVISKLKEKIEQTEKDIETLTAEKKQLEEDAESRGKAMPKLRERVTTLENDLKESKEQIARLKETIADQTIGADQARRDVQKASQMREEAVEARAQFEKQHQKELDALKHLYEPKIALLKRTDSDLDQAKEKIRQLDRSLDEEARKNRERDDEYADKILQIKRDHQKALAEQDRNHEEMKKSVIRLEEEKSKMEQRVVKAYRKLRADESQLEKVRKALEIAMGLAKLEEKVAKPTPPSDS